MTNLLSFVGIAALCAAMLWAAFRMEPHWVSKDAQRMVCYGQTISRDGRSVGRWRELRANIDLDGTVHIRPRRGGLSNPQGSGSGSGSGKSASGFMQHRMPRSSRWLVAGPSDNPPKRRVIYLLECGPDDELDFLVALRLPATSKAIPMLDAAAAKRHG
ncbi:MAG: hypothetical protein WCK14_14870 [Actinomycetota bacterium]|jgi:hypothetical protein